MLDLSQQLSAKDTGLEAGGGVLRKEGEGVASHVPYIIVESKNLNSQPVLWTSQLNEA